MGQRMVVLTPTYKPVGGVVKIFDYVSHAVALGLSVDLYCPEPLDPLSPLFQDHSRADLLQHVTFHQGFRFGVEVNDYVFFSWPTHFVDVMRRIMPETSMDRVIHIIQNTRHANPKWIGGFAYRLLSVPLTRIMITEQVQEATRSLTNPQSITRLIIEGHDWQYFHEARSGGFEEPISVGYTTWKSDIGDRVAARLGEDKRFVFRRLSGEANWPTLRQLYHASDVFLACPGPQEGMYLPGLEAFAAGAILVTPDVEGNLAYCRFGENCMEVAYEDEDDYVASLESLASVDVSTVDRLREAAYAELSQFDLHRERDSFGELLAAIS